MMRSNSISSISSLSSRCSSAEPEYTMQIFIKNIAGDSKSSHYSCVIDSRAHLMSRSLRPRSTRVNIDSHTLIPSRHPYKPSCSGHASRVCRQASGRSIKHPVGLQHWPRKYPSPGTPFARRSTQEDPLPVQGLQRCRATHRRRLRILQRTLLRQAPHARKPCLQRSRNMQGRGEAEKSRASREGENCCHQRHISNITIGSLGEFLWNIMELLWDGAL